VYVSKYDAALLEAAKNGDSPAIASLLAAAQPDIRRYARLSCSRTDDVEDAVQDTLWLLYRKVGTLRAIGSFSAWLFAVVRRECIRLARRAVGKDSVPLDVALEDPALCALMAHLPQQDLRIDVVRAMESLPEHYREVVLLRDIEEMTVDEIARTLDLTREAVKGRLHRARAMLREYLMQ
jgi:RNA polymerase sigma factor (sigma-70 family)